MCYDLNDEDTVMIYERYCSKADLTHIHNQSTPFTKVQPRREHREREEGIERQKERDRERNKRWSAQPPSHTVPPPHPFLHSHTHARTVVESMAGVC